MAKEKDVRRSLAAAGGSLGDLAGDLAAPARPAARSFAVEDAFDHPVAFKVALVGCGQGGGRMVDAFWSLGYRRCGVLNTTAQDFDGLAEDLPKLSFDTGGAGKDPAAARKAIKGRDAEVWDLFQRSWGGDPDYVLVCAGLGGGTGSGTALAAVELARRYLRDHGGAARVGAVVSLPALDEGARVARNAVEALDGLYRAGVSPLLVIDNDRVDAIYRPAFTELLPKSNAVVSRLFHALNRLAATRSQDVTFDRSEFGALLDDRLCVLGFARLDPEAIHSPADVSTRIREDLANGVLAEVDLGTGDQAALVFVGPAEVLGLFTRDYFAAGFTQLDRTLGTARTDGATVTVHRGVYRDPSVDGLHCYTMVAGLDLPRAKLDALSRLATRAAPPAAGPARHLRVD